MKKIISKIGIILSLFILISNIVLASSNLTGSYYQPVISSTTYNITLGIVFALIGGLFNSLFFSEGNFISKIKNFIFGFIFISLIWLLLMVF